MNDTQTDKLITALGDAFDAAAVRCHHKTEAAHYIRRVLDLAGYKIEPRAARRAAYSKRVKS